ncbi:MAG: AAA family ATPase [Rhodoplanes sp.]|uniref:ATP-binding protein n=1 Tax=Rhodoplanes sp. TaxID=1968906 RepID=UPI00181F5F55|nr:AAA family ATPase [Rhodoplanes sp.]NVO14887.1 AAA family ATPase [Rhodoplanes sp.]
MQLRFLLVTGPNSAPATIDFVAGLNVIYGGSNTGKSHILRLIDYCLGARKPPESITEQAEYDLVHLGIVLDDGTKKTLVRALKGGDVKLLDGLSRERPAPKQGISISAKHGAKESLSKFLLAQLNASGKRIQTSASGGTRDLSYRDIERFAIVNETKIQEATSPVLTGQYVTKTAEVSVFKYLLTGVDDSALDLAKPDPGQPLRQAAQLELIDRQLQKLEQDISESDQDYEQLEQLDVTLDGELAKSFSIQEAAERDYRTLTGQRRELRREYESVQDRLDEIDTLQARFILLAQHYDSDRERLASVIEAGTLFALEDGQVCPICGAEAEHHRPDFTCDGNVEQIVEAARAEAAELRGRAHELALTMQGLFEERAELRHRAGEILPELDALQGDILREVPSVQSVRSQTNNVVQQKLAVQKELDLIRRRNELVSQRAELGVIPGYDSSTMVAAQTLDGAILDEFSQVIESELQSWDFPNARRVFFDLPKMDISVAGKARASNGKGVMALLHGAFSIALMRFCRDRDRAHPGFLVLDSVFVTYRDPDDLEDIAIQNTPLKDKAFRAFSDLPDDYQLIVLDNVDVPDWLASQSRCTHFTGQPSVGRAGFFPSVTNQQ